MTAKSNRSMMKKSAASTADLVNGGKLDPMRADKFIDYMVDESTILKKCNVVRMTSDTHQLDTIGVQTRIIRKATENVAPTETAGIATGKRELKVEEIILPFDIGYRFLEDNIEGAAAEDHIARLFAQQFSNDIEDLGINGDTAVVAPAEDADFLSIKDGWVKIARGDSAFNKYDHNGSVDYKGVVFPGMLAALPNKWKKNKNMLVFLVAPTVEEAYRAQIAQRQTVMGDETLVNGTRQKFDGITVEPVSFLEPGTLLLTPWANLAFGIHKREIMIEKERRTRKRVIEYTTTARIGYQWSNPAAAVISENFA